LRDKVASTVGSKNKYDIEDETSVFYETDIVHTVGDDIIEMHTDGKRKGMWDTLYIGEVNAMLGDDAAILESSEDALGYAWFLEAYMEDEHIKKSNKNEKK